MDQGVSETASASSGHPAAENAAPVKYFVDPLGPFPKRWRDRHGNITVMAEPIKGYLMCRRPGCIPFVLSVAQILNAEKHSTHGPFMIIPAKDRK